MAAPSCHPYPIRKNKERYLVSKSLASFVEPRQGPSIKAKKNLLQNKDLFFLSDERLSLKGLLQAPYRPLRDRTQLAEFANGKIQRPRVGGKFLFVGNEKFWVRGVTYGAFRPGPDGQEYHDPAVLERDFSLMSANGLNTVRIPHTMPPRELLDIAQKHGLRVMVGLSAEQYIGFLIEPRSKRPDIGKIIRERVRSVAGHPALLAYALGNEVSAHHARWIGHRKIERYLERLYKIVKQEDPLGLVTYVNYPTTEYLDLAFLDFVCFNVYLESQIALEAYLPRLQN